MENKNISEIAFERIKESGIKPISKNVFSFKRFLFWSLVGLSLAFGAISFSVLLSVLLDNDWYLYNRFGFNFIFRSLPYFWFVFLAVFTILGDFYYRKTYLGYRRSTITIIFIYITITVIFGLILHTIGIGNKIERSLSENVSVYRGFMFDKSEFWSHPEDGLVFGSIIAIEGDLIKIRDDKNNLWNVKIKEAFIGGRVQIKEGEMVKIFGDVEADGLIVAEQIRPWKSNNFNRTNKKFNLR
jgi:hypothetical protein